MDAAVAALLGGVVGGIFGGGASFLVTWYSLKKQGAMDIWTRKASRLDQADAKLFNPFLESVYRLDAKHDVNDLNGILEALRNGRACFTYCPSDLRQNLRKLFRIMERRIEEVNGNWQKEDIGNITPDIKQVETGIDEVLSSMEL